MVPTVKTPPLHGINVVNPPPTVSDESLGYETPVSKLSTPNFEKIMNQKEMVQEELMREWNWKSGNLEGGPRPSSKEEDPQIILPPTKRSSSSVRPQGKNTGAFPFYSFIQTTSGSSMNHTTLNTPLQIDQGHITSCTPSLHDPHDHPEKKHPVDSSRNCHLKSQASHDSMETEKIQITAQQKAESVDLEHKPNQQMATSNASIQGGCLCGCGGDAVHCLRPNRPASPNTFWENFYAPNFVRILQDRLENVATKLEPSKRIWWRETFGGCAPDREPTDMEIWGRKGDDWGNVLRTSPLLSFDDNESSEISQNPRFGFSRKRPRWTSLPNSPTHSLNKTTDAPSQVNADEHNHAPKSFPLYESGEISARQSENHWSSFATHHSFTPNVAAVHDRGEISAKTFTNRWNPGGGSGRPHFRAPTVTPETKPLKSPTHYIPDRLPPLKIPDFSKNQPTHHKRKELTAEEDEQLLQSALKKLERARLKMHRYRISRGQDKNPIPENPLSISQGGHFEDGMSHTLIMQKESLAEEVPKLNQPLYQKIEAMKLRRSSCRAAVPYRHDDVAVAFSPSASHADDIKEIPLNIPVITKEHTTEALKQVNQPSLKSPTHYVPDRLPPLRLPDFSVKHSPRHKIKEITAKEHEELLQSALQKLEIARLERHRRLGIPLKLSRQLSTEDYSHKSDNVVDVLPKTEKLEKGPTSEGLHQSLYQRIAAMKARRNGRFSIAIHRSEATAADILPSTAPMDQVNEIPSNMQAMKDEFMTDEPHKLKRTLLEKVEAMRLRRNSRHGTALYRHDDMTSKISVPASAMEDELMTDEPQKLKRTLLEKIEAMKLRRNSRHGTALYQHDDMTSKISVSASQVNGIKEFPLDFQILRNERIEDEVHQREEPFE